MWFRVGEDTGQQRWSQVVVVGVASVQVKVQCGRCRWVQVVCGQEHPAGFSQQLQTNSGLTLPLGPDRNNKNLHLHQYRHNNCTLWFTLTLYFVCTIIYFIVSKSYFTNHLSLLKVVFEHKCISFVEIRRTCEHKLFSCMLKKNDHLPTSFNNWIKINVQFSPQKSKWKMFKKKKKKQKWNPKNKIWIMLDLNYWWLLLQPITAEDPLWSRNNKNKSINKKSELLFLLSALWSCAKSSRFDSALIINH